MGVPMDAGYMYMSMYMWASLQLPPLPSARASCSLGLSDTKGHGAEWAHTSRACGRVVFRSGTNEQHDGCATASRVTDCDCLELAQAKSSSDTAGNCWDGPTCRCS